MKYIIVIECTDAGGIEIGMAISQMGFKPLFLLNPESYKADIGLALQSFEFCNVNTLSVEQIINQLTPLKDKIAGIGTMVDSRIAIATEVAKKMNLPGPDVACITLKDKAKVAEICERDSMQTMVLNQDISVTKSMLNTVFKNKRIVVKDRTGCGAIGLQILSSEQERNTFTENTPQLDNWIAQEYFEGKLFSIEGWVQNSEVTFLGWTSRRKIANTETEFRFEGYQTISNLLTNKAKDVVNNLFAKTNLSRGWFHIEFLINEEKNELTMIDANVGRVGGAMLPHVLAMTFGKTPADIYQHALEIQIFGKSSIYLDVIHPSEKIYKCVCFGSPEEIIIQDVHLPKYPLHQPGLRMVRILGTGDHVTKIGHDDMSWIGFVAGAEKDVDLYASKIQITSQDGIQHAASF